MRYWFAAALFCLCSCDKVPLRANNAQFSVASSHFFANEKTQYLFFRISGLRAAQARTSWPSALEISTPTKVIAGLKPGSDGFAPLDLSQGVHRHRLVECGEGQLCGSFSFHTEQPVQDLDLRFRYNAQSPLGESTKIYTSVHPAGATAAAQSALVFGVFNGNNSRVQVRIHDNFGDPDSSEIAQFGMERNFEIESLQLADVSVREKSTAQSMSGSPFLFPAEPCNAHIPKGTPGTKWRFAGHESWSPASFDPQDLKGSACFTARSLDAKGAVLSEAPAMARRNPVLQPEPLRVKPPLQESFNIPVIISYCLDRPDSAKLVEPEFLNYQRFILDLPKDTVDVCFAVGEEERFARDLDRVLNQKLATARLSNHAGADFFFKVAIHHRLAPSVHEFHDIIAEKLSAKINAEVAMVSPRLVGAFVYDSQSVDTRLMSRSTSIVWCPRRESPNEGERADQEANCTPTGSGNINLGPFNFLIPMGPFPTLDKFMENFRKNGDRGQSMNPRLNVQSVKTNPNSETNADNSRLYTFFDGQRLSLAQDERLKFCRDRDAGQLLEDLAFRYVTPFGEKQILSVDEAQNVMSNAPSPTLNVGLWWDSPFIGGFSFDSPVRGKIFGIIPLQKTFRSEQKMGDELWRNGTWNLTPLLQKCLRHCDHPYFDEGGVYQINQDWNSVPTCPSPKPAEPQ